MSTADADFQRAKRRWSKARLDDVCSLITDGTHQTPTYVEDGVLFLSAKNVVSGKIDWQNVKRIPSWLHSELHKRVSPQKGDLLLAKNGTTGVAAVVDRDEIFDIYVSLALLRPKPHVIPEYLYRALNCPATRRQFHEALKGIGVPNLHLKDIRGTTILIPPLAEQLKIAEILDRAEVLRWKRYTSLAKLDALTQSIFIDLFGAPAENPKRWVQKRICELGKVITGSTPPSTEPNMFDGPIPFVTPGDLESDEPIKRSLTTAGAQRSRTVRCGATLVCCIGTIGKMGIAGELCAFNQQINAVEWSSQIEDIYGFAVLRFFKPTIKAWGASTTVPILKKSSFEKIEIPVPPLPLQAEFVRRFEAVERLRDLHRAALKKIDELFSVLEFRAFRGEL